MVQTAPDVKRTLDFSARDQVKGVHRPTYQPGRPFMDGWENRSVFSTEPKFVRFQRRQLTCGGRLDRLDIIEVVHERERLDRGEGRSDTLGGLKLA